MEVGGYGGGNASFWCLIVRAGGTQACSPWQNSLSHPPLICALFCMGYTSVKFLKIRKMSSVYTPRVQVSHSAKSSRGR